MDKKLNELESTNNPQLHLRAIDAENDKEATKIVFHKMEDGSLFFELEPSKEFKDAGAWRIQTNFDKYALDKLKEFLKNELTY
mgnify:CR=1 FL=1